MSTGEFRASIPRLTAWVLLAFLGGALWGVTVATDGSRAWRALLENFLFFTSLAGGLVVWPAVVRGCNGEWHEGLERLAAAAIPFAVPSVILLVVLWIGSPNWSPWYAVPRHQGLWLDNTVVFARNVGALVLFWIMAAFYLRKRERGKAPGAGAALIVIYSLVFSLLGLDLVMGLDPKWYSTLAGAYFFISALYIGITCWGFLAAWDPDATKKQLQDIGCLTVAFSLMTTYMMYAHLVAIWYENLPHEVRFVIPRMHSPSWKGISYLLIGVVYFGPLILFLTQRAKRNRLSMGVISLIVLVGLWVERWWLVAPTFMPVVQLGLAEIAGALLCLGLLGLSMEIFHRSAPRHYLKGESR